MAISETLKTAINKLVVGMFDMAAGGYYVDMEYFITNGMPFEDLAIGLGKTQTFLTLYPSYYTGRQFADAFLSNLIVGYSSSSPGLFAGDRNWIEESYNAGAERGKIMLDVISALNGLSSSDSVYGKSKQALINKTDVASYYTMSLAGSSKDAANLRLMLDGVTHDASTVSAAISLINANNDATVSGINLTYASSITSAIIPLDGNSGVVNIASGSTLSSVTFLGSGRDSYISLTNSGLAPVTAIKISGDKALNINLSDSNIATAKTVDASSLTANMTLTMNDTLNKDFIITGGSKNDIIDMGRKLTSTDSIDAKAGANTLKVNFVATNTTDSKLINIQSVELTAACDLDISGQTENFTVIGSSSADNITLGSGNDTVSSGSGNDIIRGGDGSDVITTGSGSDIIVFEAVYGVNIIDTIKDFTYGSDKLDFSLFLVTEDNEAGVESILTTAVALSAGIDLSADGGDADTVIDNVGVVYGATNGEISKVNIALSTTPGIAVAGKVTLLDNTKAVVLSKASNDSSMCKVYFIEDKNTSDDMQEWNVKLVGILEGNSNYSANDMAQSQNFY